MQSVIFKTYCFISPQFQLGTLLGCVINLRASVAGITIIALGTSVPDMFASRTAAIHDQYADAAIGNITGECICTVVEMRICRK